jgi:tRNA threonylcarbamoyladenosine biosynthesis protein TsaB
MRIIGFDTATDDTVVAALDGDRVAFEFRGSAGDGQRPTHSADLVPAIEEAAAALGGWGEVDRLAVGVGPGTFTGLRIGIATAQGIRLSSPVDIVPVCTLVALALSLDAPADAVRVPVLDARRGEVFLAAYDGSGRELFEPSVGGPADLFGRVASAFSDPFAAGPGALRFRSDLEQAGLDTPGPQPESHRLSGSAICRAARTLPVAPTKEPIEPIYLRAPDAERWIDRRPGAGS